MKIFVEWWKTLGRIGAPVAAVSFVLMAIVLLMAGILNPTLVIAISGAFSLVGGTIASAVDSILNYSRNEYNRVQDWEMGDARNQFQLTRSETALLRYCLAIARRGAGHTTNLDTDEKEMTWIIYGVLPRARIVAPQLNTADIDVMVIIVRQLVDAYRLRYGRKWGILPLFDFRQPDLVINTWLGLRDNHPIDVQALRTLQNQLTQEVDVAQRKGENEKAQLLQVRLETTSEVLMQQVGTVSS